MSPAVEDLEGRLVLSGVLPFAASQAAPMITDVEVDDGELVASGTISGLAFTSQIDVGMQQTSAGTTILDLELQEITIDLLGLVIDTSDICLTITAEPGPGNLLGNLLSGLAGILDPSQSGSVNLDDLSSAQTRGLAGMAEAALGGALASSSLSTSQVSASQVPEGACSILSLSLGPVDLNLLGLRVQLNNCDGGPVTVDVYAVPGPGNLLGNLLCGLTGILNP